MRAAVLFIAAAVAIAQTQAPGKPGVTDPIKDPRQIPGHPTPGPIPRETPQPSADANTRDTNGKTTKQKSTAGKKKAKKSSQSEQ